MASKTLQIRLLDLLFILTFCCLIFSIRKTIYLEERLAALEQIPHYLQTNEHEIHQNTSIFEISETVDDYYLHRQMFENQIIGLWEEVDKLK